MSEFLTIAAGKLQISSKNRINLDIQKDAN